mgnify:CR=1 FL=1
MTTNRDLLKQRLKSSGYSITSTRLHVFTALEKSEPLSMEQLVKQVSSHVNRASVYRTIDLFEKLGIVQRLQIGWKYKLELSNEFQEHHHHIICTRCGKINTFREPGNLDYMLSKIAEAENFVLQHHQLELRGLCKSCQKQT